MGCICHRRGLGVRADSRKPDCGKWSLVEGFQPDQYRYFAKKRQGMSHMATVEANLSAAGLGGALERS